MNPNDIDTAPDAPGLPEEPEVAPKPKRRKAPAKSPVADVQNAGAPALASVDTGQPPEPALPASVQAILQPDAGDSTLTSELPPAELAAPVAGQAQEADADRGPRRQRNRRRGRRDERGAVADAGPARAEAGHETGDGQLDARREPRVDAPRPAPVDVTGTFADVVSGAYDALPEVEATSTQEAAPAEPAERRVLAPEPDTPKLHKLLAQSGIGSRRDMEQLIEDGKVTVNDQVAHVGQRISFGDQVRVAGRLVKLRITPPLPRVLAYHKPVGEVVTHDDPQNRPTVFRRLPRLAQGKWQSVGRLDINTEGLLLFTTSGDLANQLMHPRFGVEREYAVRVLGTLDDETRTKLLEGVEIEGQRAAFMSIDDGGGEGANHWYRVVITEGRNREVRKLFDRVGLGVSRLIRIRYGCVVLPRGLKRGVYVDLNEAEVRELRRLAGGRGPTQAQPPALRGEGAGESGGPSSRRNRRRGRGDRPVERSAEAPVDRPDAVEDFGRIPNPLQQTFDKRAIREARQPRRDYAEDGPIPNPLEQTYDKRFVQKPRGPGSGQGKRSGGEPGQPDPMKTSLGYIGADAFVRKFQGGGGGPGGRGGRRRSGR